MLFGEFIKQKRIEAGISLEDVVLLLDTSYENIVFAECCIFNPFKLEDLNNLIKAYNLNSEEADIVYALASFTHDLDELDKSIYSLFSMNADEMKVWNEMHPIVRVGEMGSGKLSEVTFELDSEIMQSINNGTYSDKNKLNIDYVISGRQSSNRNNKNSYTHACRDSSNTYIPFELKVKIIHEILNVSKIESDKLLMELLQSPTNEKINEYLAKCEEEKEVK